MNERKIRKAMKARKVDPLNTFKAMANKKFSQIVEDTPEGNLGLHVIKRAVRDIGTQHEDPDCWFDGSLDGFMEMSGVSAGYIVRVLREYKLIPATRVLN